VVAGYGLAGLGKVFVVLSTTWGGVLFGRVTDRIGKGMRSAPRDALIGDGIDEKHLGKAFGFHRMSDTIGAVIGPLLALGGLALLNEDVRAVAVWALIPALLSGLFTLFVRDSIRVKSTKEQLKVVSKTPLPSAVKRNIAILAVIGLSNVPDALLLLRLHDIGFSASAMVLSYVLFNLVAVFVSLPFGNLADRVSPVKIYAAALAIFAVAYGALGLSNNPVVAVIAIGLYGFFPAMTDGVGKAWISRQTPVEIRGKAQGWFQAMMNFSILGAGIWAGAIWLSGSTEPALVAAAGLALAGSAFLAIRFRKDR
jgi:MFS family permease